MRGLALLLSACSFHGPNATGVSPAPDADVNPIADAGVTGDAATCAAAEVFAGRYHTCARRTDGEVWCWGRNSQGEAGTAPAVDVASCPTFPNRCIRAPQHVAMPAASTLGLGTSDTCAIAGTTTYCWGADDGQEFGDNSFGDAYAPRPIAARASSTAIAIGDQHTCSISATNHDVECSGFNSYGEVGDNTGMPRAVPTPVNLPAEPTAIGLGWNHSCAVAGGKVFCWGSNEQLEVSPSVNTGDYDFPVQVPNITTATAVGGGDQHSCAVLVGGTAKCWGSGGYGQLGDGTFPIMAAALVTVALPNIVAIRPGDIHTCALTSAGGVWCWGSSFVPAAAGAGHPDQIALPANAISLAAGGDHDCAVLVDGTVWCWGNNDHGQLGTGTTTSPVGRATAVRAKLCN